MAYRNVFQMTDEQVRNLIFRELKDAPENTRRKDLIERCIRALGFTPAEMRDGSTSSPVVRAKSRIGMILSSAQKAGYILESESGKLQLIGVGHHVVGQEKARDYILSLLERAGSMSKSQILRQAETDFGVDKTTDRKDDSDLHAVLRTELAKLEEEGHLLRHGYQLRLTVDTTYPNTEMGSVLRAASHGGDLKKCFLRAVHIRGGEWFESYCVDLLDSYYRSCGKEVLSASVTGGSDDGGIDGIIKTQDSLGYRETVLMQMKNRKAVMVPKDLREFYGAVCAENGTRGIFITVSSFHPEAWRFINRVDNLTGLDGEKLYELACVCGKGILLENGAFSLDEALFLAE